MKKGTYIVRYSCQNCGNIGTIEVPMGTGVSGSCGYCGCHITSGSKPTTKFPNIIDKKIYV